MSGVHSTVLYYMSGVHSTALYCTTCQVCSALYCTTCQVCTALHCTVLHVRCTLPRLLHEVCARHTGVLELTILSSTWHSTRTTTTPAVHCVQLLTHETLGVYQEQTWRTVRSSRTQLAPLTEAASTCPFLRQSPIPIVASYRLCPKRSANNPQVHGEPWDTASHFGLWSPQAATTLPSRAGTHLYFGFPSGTSCGRTYFLENTSEQLVSLRVDLSNKLSTAHGPKASGWRGLKMRALDRNQTAGFP